MVAPSTGMTKRGGINATINKRMSAEVAAIRRTLVILFMKDETDYLQESLD